MTDKKLSDEVGYYMGWYVAYGLFACFSIYFFWQVESVDFCVEADKHCFRDWVSATGGWAAVPAAALTIWFLSRQIASADRHHQDTIRLNHAQKYQIAKFIRAEAAGLNRAIDRVRAHASEGHYYEFDLAGQHVLWLLERNLERDKWDYFEREFFMPSRVSLTEIRSLVSGMAADQAHQMNPMEFSGSDYAGALGTIEDFNAYAGEAADDYILFVDRILQQI